MSDRILLGQLGANGDCLYATILARQLRQDYPKATITWAISDRSASLLTNNPHVDEVWKIPVERVLNPCRETSTSARILLARSVDEDFERTQIERHIPSP